MSILADGKAQVRKKLFFVFLSALAVLGIARSLASGKYVLFLLPLLGLAGVLVYLKEFEAFILLTLVLNQELFNLIPREVIGEWHFQDFLLPLLVLTGGLYFFRRKEAEEVRFEPQVIFFFLLVLMAVINASFQGQSLILGLKDGRMYFLILFYFVYMARRINAEKFYTLVVISCLVLMILNNLQYVFFGKISIFHYSLEDIPIVREGRMRFLLGDFFTIFGPLITLGEFLRTRKKIYFALFLYFLGTVVIQGLTRAVILGLVASLFLMLYLARRINLVKSVLIGAPVLAILVWLSPVIKTTVFGSLFETTRYEFTERTGNVGVRLEAYAYYMGEFLRSPLVGRGIWSEAYEGPNPQHQEDKGLYLSDIGIMNLFFHFGLLGVLWLLWLLRKVYSTAFEGLGQLKDYVHPGLIGYFFFGMVTLLTLDSFTGSRTILYLALVLALLSQSKLAPGEEEEGEEFA